MIRRQFLLFCATSLSGILIAKQSIASGHEDKKKGGGDGYTQFRTLTVFTQASSTKHGTLSVDMGLYTDDPKLTEQIKLFMPRLLDAYVSRLQAYAANLRSRSMLDPDFIILTLQQATDQVLGRKGAKVLLGTILIN
jgi:hypothetical protein